MQDLSGGILFEMTFP